ncbi:U-box domain-containing protein 25-like [Arachis ipaensis]|uniref:U-box domain-containing protein 25-like n=1 Tax=Arachis ipaensis TaxID=130454 RepID=UPI0007AF9819|nr:U-box domain-containing protein 25-like [Arachis ipaensis]
MLFFPTKIALFILLSITLSPLSFLSGREELQSLKKKLPTLLFSFLPFPCIQFGMYVNFLSSMNEARIEITIPHLFRCPISLDLLEDPVTLCTGQTYDRSSIEKWLSAGNLTCPVTMQKLHDPSIVPNHTLRHLIDQWLQLGYQFHPGNSATIDYLTSLKHALESRDSSLDHKLQALHKIQVLSDEYCSFKRTCFNQLSYLTLLLQLVFETRSMEFTELALSCIVKLLPLVNLDPLNMIKDESKLSTFVSLLEKGTTKTKTSLCHLIDSTATSTQTQELCHVLGNSRKVIEEIVRLAREIQEEESSKAGIKAMSALCSLQSNRESLVRGGAIDGVIAYMLESDKLQKNLAPMAMGIIEKLVVLESGKVGVVNHPSGIQTVVKMVFRVCNNQEYCCSEVAVGVLLVICRDYGVAREEAIGAGILTQLLFLLQSQCGNKTKTKARMLLKLLRSKWNQESNNKL